MFLHNGKTTDLFIQDALKISKNVDKRELDVLMSVGEQVTIAKLAMCLKSLGYEAVSLTGWQVPIKTDCNYGDANIEQINLNRIKKELENNKIVIAAGFQGINEETNDITTLRKRGIRYNSSSTCCSIKSRKM